MVPSYYETGPLLICTSFGAIVCLSESQAADWGSIICKSGSCTGDQRHRVCHMLATVNSAEHLVT